VTPELPGDLRELLRHLEAAWPDEGCGLILRGPAGWRVRPMRNAQDRYHAKDPVRYPRSARTAYLFDPAEQLEVEREREPLGEEIVCIFHSHADTDACFSTEDREMAAPFGEPWMPKVSYLVVSVVGGGARAANLYWWSGRDFTGAKVTLS
jgi:proteasome lid subunit RPN8/RPN11